MNILTIIGSFLKRLRSGAFLDPVHDWLVLFALSMIALASIVVWNIWAFNTIANGGVIGAPNTVVPDTFNRSSLDTIHAIFADRATEETKYTTGVYRYADPSQ